jgi:hypothetical protein
MNRSSIALMFVLGIPALGITSTANYRLPGDDTAAQLAASSADERNKAFNWFETLGFPDVKGRKFVRTATGRWYSSGGDPPRNTFIRGFLLKEEGDEFTLVTLSLATETYRKTPAKTPAHKQVGYEAVDLATGATAILKKLRAPKRSEDGDAKPLWGTDLHDRTETFVLAWACRRNGLDKLAAELYDHASKMPQGYGYNPDKPPTQPLKQLVADDLAHTEMWRGILAFEDPAIPRTELLKRFERIVKNYPESEHQERAKDTVALLQKMVKEDAEHAKEDRKPFEQLGKKEQIAELIFQLRDQNGRQYMQPGACDIFDRLGGKEDTPAHRLVKMGYDAVPQLIEAIEDQRFTRSVGYHRNFYFSHYVLRVGDCALAVLERITARSFWQASSTFSYLTKDNKAAEAKKKVQAWYDEFQKKGEKRMLIEAVERGDRDSHHQATLLLERYPDEALPALKAGIKAAKDSWSRDLLVASVAGIKGDSPLPLLLAEVKEGPYSYGRVVAAKSLHQRGRPEGVAAMIAEWQGERPEPKPEPGVKRDEVEEPGAGLSSIAEFLATCGKVEAIAALEKDLRKRPVGLRLAVVSAFGESGNRYNISKTSGGSIQPGEKPARENTKEGVAAIEHLLFGALDDTEERTGMSGSWNGKNYTDPRICDVAGHVLNQLAPDKYAFDLGAPLARRDRAIVELKNVRRKAHGLALLPVPVLKVIAPIPDEKLQPLIEKLLQTPEAERPKASAKIEELGLGALPGIQKRLAGITKKDDPERAVLEKLAQRIACIIDEATLTENSVKPDVVVGKLRNMKGRPFESGSFMELIRSLVKDLPEGVHALRFTVDRTGDGTGVALKVTLLDETRAKQLGRGGSSSRDPKTPKGVPSSWDHYEDVDAGGKGLYGVIGICDHDHWLKDKHTELADAITAACSVSPDKPFTIRIQMIPDLGK